MRQHHIDGNIKIFPNRNYQGFVTPQDLLLDGKLSTQEILGKSFCFKNNLFDEELPRFQDWELSIRLAKQYKVVIQDCVLVDQYLQKDSISYGAKKALEAIEIIERKYEQIISADNKIKASIWARKGFYTLLNHKNPRNEYAVSVKSKFTLKSAIFLVMSVCGVINLFARLHYGILYTKR